MKVIKAPECDIALKLTREEFQNLKPHFEVRFELPLKEENGKLVYALRDGRWLMFLIKEKE